MAASLKEALGVDSLLVEGERGEFTVWVDGRKVMGKGWLMKPSPEKVVATVRAAMA